MKPIKVEDQKLLNLADKMQRSTIAMNYWTDIAMTDHRRFWDALREKYKGKLDENCVYNDITRMVTGSHEKDSQESQSTKEA